MRVCVAIGRYDRLQEPVATGRSLSAGTARNGRSSRHPTQQARPACSMTWLPWRAHRRRRASASACTAVGRSSRRNEDTLAERWNGLRWSIQRTPTPRIGAGHLEDVSCPSLTTCVAVGWSDPPAEQRMIVERWNGTVWSIQSTPTRDIDWHLVPIDDCLHGRRTSPQSHPGDAMEWHVTGWVLALRSRSSRRASPRAKVVGSIRAGGIGMGLQDAEAVVRPESVSHPMQSLRRSPTEVGERAGCWRMWARHGDRSRRHGHRVPVTHAYPTAAPQFGLRGRRCRHRSRAFVPDRHP